MLTSALRALDKKFKVEIFSLGFVYSTHWNIKKQRFLYGNYLLFPFLILNKFPKGRPYKVQWRLKVKPGL